MEAKIDWSKAPEGATHYIEDKEYNGASEFVIIGVEGSLFAYDSFGMGGWSVDVNDDNDFKITPIPESKPVYTQAMCDAGELPPVGSEFMHKGEKVECISTSDEEGGVVTFLNDARNIECCWNNDTWVRAIDTRTDEQKCVDNMMYAYRKGESMADVLSEIKKGYIHGVTWSKS